MDIASFSKIVRTQGFNTLPFEEKQKAFAENFPGFESLSAEEQMKGMRELSLPPKPEPVQQPRPQQVQPSDQPDFSGLPVGNPQMMGHALNAPFAPLQAVLNAPGAVSAEGLAANPEGLETKGMSILDFAGGASRGMMQQGGASAALPFDITKKEDFGDMADTLGRVGTEFAAMGPYAAGGAKLMGGLAGELYVSTIAKADERISRAVKLGMSKGVKPTVTGKGDFGKVKNFFDRSERAVTKIVESSPGKLPTNLEEFSEAIYRTKKKVHETYSTMAKQAGQEGAAISLAPIRQDLETIIEQPNVRQSVKDLANNMLKEISPYDEAVNPAVAEDLIASFNAETKAFWKNPNPNEASSAVMKERIAKQLRASMDDAVSKYKGEGYQELKNDYGALRSIEKEVTDRAIVDMRKNAKGFYDLADIASAGEFALGLTRMDPSLMVSAAAIKMSKRFIKWINNPNRYVKNMFHEVDMLTRMKGRFKAPEMPPQASQPQIAGLIEYDPVNYMEPGTNPIFLGPDTKPMPLMTPGGVGARSVVPQQPRTILQHAEVPLPDIEVPLRPDQRARLMRERVIQESKTGSPLLRPGWNNR